MKYNVLINDSIDSQKWNDYVMQNARGTCFHTPWIFSLFNENPLLKSFVIAITDDTNTIKALGQGYLQTVNSFVPAYLSRRAVLMQSVLYDCSHTLDSLLKALNVFLGRKAVYTEIRCCSPELAYNDVYISNGYVFEDHLDIIIDLTPGCDNLFNLISKTRRKQILRGYSRGVHVDVVSRNDIASIQKCYDIVSRLYTKISLPCPDWNVWLSALTYNPKKDEPKAVCFAARFDDLIIGTRVVICFKKRIFDWYAASMDDHNDKYPNDILPWEVFKWGHENGFEEFDFGGAGKPNIPYGVRDYKLKFGGVLVNHGRFQRINSPLRYAIASMGFKVFRRVITSSSH